MTSVVTIEWWYAYNYDRDGADIDHVIFCKFSWIKNCI